MNHTDPTARPPLLAAALALELDRDAASTGESADYWRGMTRAVELLRILNQDEPAAPVLVSPPPDHAPLRDRVAAAARTVSLRLGPNALAMAERGEPIILSGGEADMVADAVLAVLPESGRAATLLDAAEAIDAETRQLKADGVLEPDKFRPCRDVAEQLRRLAAEAPTCTPGQPCNAAVMHRLGNLATTHGPHLWVVQPGMDPVRCPGTPMPQSEAGEAPTVTSNTDGGVILHLPEITHLDTQVWSVDIGLTPEGLAALRAVLNGAEAPQPDTEARPRQASWRVETYDPDAGEWAPGSHFLCREAAVERRDTATERAPRWADDTPVQRRIVRETTTYSVEPPSTGVPTLLQLADADPEYREVLLKRGDEMTAVSQPAADGGEETPLTVTTHPTRCWPCMTDDCPTGPHQVDDMPDVACGCGCVSEGTR
ncbi:hypothetical protein D0Z67_29275 (plasmid) [Streptomyces seoulensis]|uniref:Uncharacterized protein n=1 Tax=Streptomyces seoulensis TaxID=73044 RepID=A0A4P6U4W6_STRSO|nr:hypothetical protein [Streptomyces seoulensis]QBJ94463.1 hypothetical protein D0Z67_29275 [Streptomyces seoulensis]